MRKFEPKWKVTSKSFHKYHSVSSDELDSNCDGVRFYYPLGLRSTSKMDSLSVGTASANSNKQRPLSE